ncbi:hypothetical protein FOXB_01977 [Fusarium oxysporum f. sp. conglutinans Fo5176]|uniref:Uncharacterized protein n=1 Tax=Fusarium oxysporum (strain Fo5176) TaxID=660025 RepID=F9F6F2_FUSOF|nr:hypothetical protein FOXB_01977 [Fusarium oxysporum f. sp. conglutinans Fo5176]
MSGKQPPETSYVQFTRDRLSRQQAAAFSKLNESIPKDENQWQEAREVHRFATPEDVHRTVSSLVQDIQGEFLPEDLRRLIYIAVCCVEHSENEAEAYRKYRSRVHAKDDLREFTIRNYMSLVRAAIALEVQASLPLYLPFIVATRHPEHPYETVCRALGTNILSKEDYFKFVSVLQRGGPGRYDPVRDQWLPVTVPNLAGFKPFEIPESIQQIIARAGKQQDDPASQDIPGAIIFTFRWSRDHQKVVDRVIDILVS